MEEYLKDHSYWSQKITNQIGILYFWKFILFTWPLIKETLSLEIERDISESINHISIEFSSFLCEDQMDHHNSLHSLLLLSGQYLNYTKINLTLTVSDINYKWCLVWLKFSSVIIDNFCHIQKSTDIYTKIKHKVNFVCILKVMQLISDLKLEVFFW